MSFLPEFDSLENQIRIKQASDFGVIDSTKEYFLDGIVDMGATSIEIPSGGINIKGYDFNISGLTSSESGYTMFTSPVGGSGDILWMDFKIEVTGVGSQVLDVVADTGGEAYEIERINFNNCTSKGEIDGYRQGLESGTGRFGGTPNLILSGTWAGGYFIDVSIVRGLTDGSYALYEEGTAFIMASRFRSNQNIDLNATVAFLDFSPANFENSLTLQLDGCLISRNGIFDLTDSTIIPNISQTDIASNWGDNIGIENTYQGGSLEVSSEATTTISTISTFVDVAGTFSASSLDHFDSPSNSKLRYLSSAPNHFRIIGTLICESSPNDVLGLRLAIFRDATSTFEFTNPLLRQVNSLVGGRDVATFTQIGAFILNENDIINLQVSNESGTSDITMEDNSFIRVEERG